jgi:hypothetical protein
MISAALKALHQSHPGMFLTDVHGAHANDKQTTLPGNNLFLHNPLITDLSKAGSHVVRVNYGPGVQSCGRPYHFLHAVVEEFERKLGVPVHLRDFHGDIYLSDEERQPWPGLPDPYAKTNPQRYAIVDAGYKNDFTAKMWSFYRFQQVVNETKDEITWVQIGAAGDNHRILDNCINLVGQTNLRQLIRVFHRASIVLTPVSLPMHLAAAVPTPADGPKEMPLTLAQLHERWHYERQAAKGIGQGPPPLPGGSRASRPCVVLMGMREARQWELYPGHVALGTTGKLKCGVDVGSSGCWVNKVIKVDQDNSVCRNPLRDEENFAVPECLHRVTVDDVVKAIRSFL